MDAKATWAVFRFELSRALTTVRMLFWVAMVCFPPLLVTLTQLQTDNQPDLPDTVVTIFLLVPEVVCLMGLLLWATPAIHAELEGKTWSYLAVRPGGKGSVLLGKYLAAVAWTMPAALLSLVICLGLAPAIENKLNVGSVMTALVLLSCFTYGALYTLFSTLFLRRAMMVAVGYTFISEVLVGMVPAIVNQFTVQYHLRCLMGLWIRFDRLPISFRPVFGLTRSGTPESGPWWQHVLLLLGATAVLLTLAVTVLRRRELVTADDT